MSAEQGSAYIEKLAALLAISDRGEDDDKKGGERKDAHEQVGESTTVELTCSVCYMPYPREQIVVVPCCGTIVCHDCADHDGALVKYRDINSVCAAAGCGRLIRENIEEWDRLSRFKGVAGVLRKIRGEGEQTTPVTSASEVLAKDDGERGWLGSFRCHSCGARVANDGTACDAVVCDNCNGQTNVLMGGHDHTFHLRELKGVMAGEFADRDSLAAELLSGAGSSSDAFKAFIALKLPLAVTRAMRACCTGNDSEVVRIVTLLNLGEFQKFADYVLKVVASIAAEKHEFYARLMGCGNLREIQMFCEESASQFSAGDLQLLREMKFGDDGVTPDPANLGANCGLAWTITDPVLSNLVFSFVTNPAES